MISCRKIECNYMCSHTTVLRSRAGKNVTWVAEVNRVELQCSSAYKAMTCLLLLLHGQRCTACQHISAAPACAGTAVREGRADTRAGAYCDARGCTSTTALRAGTYVAPCGTGSASPAAAIHAGSCGCSCSRSAPATVHGHVFVSKN